MGIRLIVSDIDGTILPEGRDVRDGVEALAGLIRERALPFTLASGRPLFMMEELRCALGLTLPMVAANGASAGFCGMILWNDFLDAQAVRPAILLADSLDMAVILTDGGNEYVYRELDYTKRHSEAGKKWVQGERPGIEEDWEHCSLQKLLIIDPASPGKVDEIIRRLEADCGDACHIVRYDDRGIEVMPKNCTKGEGVRRLAEALGIPLSEVMVLGDNKNDLAMFREAGLRVAVGNAVEALKEEADYVCEKEAVYGVIEAVEKFCR